MMTVWCDRKNCELNIINEGEEVSYDKSAIGEGYCGTGEIYLDKTGKCQNYLKVVEEHNK